VLLAACADPGDVGAGGATPGSATESSAAPAPEILDFSAPKLGGGTVRGAEYAGADLAIWFWAPW